MTHVCCQKQLSTLLPTPWPELWPSPSTHQQHVLPHSILIHPPYHPSRVFGTMPAAPGVCPGRPQECSWTPPSVRPTISCCTRPHPVLDPTLLVGLPRPRRDKCAATSAATCTPRNPRSEYHLPLVWHAAPLLVVPMPNQHAGFSCCGRAVHTQVHRDTYGLCADHHCHADYMRTCARATLHQCSGAVMSSPLDNCHMRPAVVM
jgi:hypothetical protein